MNKSELLCWVDLESFGLDENHDPIIEIGIRVTDLDLTGIASRSWLVWSPAHDLRLKHMKDAAAHGDKNNKYVLNMHSNNRLFDEASKRGYRPAQVELDITTWMESADLTGLPMCGSSVGFDQRFIRAQMPKVLDLFHYRIIDNSSTKELCRRYNPRVFEKAPRPIAEEHRALPDLRNSIEEFRYYRDNFLFDARNDV